MNDFECKRNGNKKRETRMERFATDLRCAMLTGDIDDTELCDAFLSLALGGGDKVAVAGLRASIQRIRPEVAAAITKAEDAIIIFIACIRSADVNDARLEEYYDTLSSHGVPASECHRLHSVMHALRPAVARRIERRADAVGLCA
ncbi:MAG: hypothetical protein RLZZ324_95 [Candidatus Parcubacteria bacterium]